MDGSDLLSDLAITVRGILCPVAKSCADEVRIVAGEFTELR